MLPEKLLSCEEAARLLDSTPGGVRNMVYRGQIPHIKRGRRLLFDPRDLASWLDAKKRGPSSPKGR
jgi:excisionase family DNA binding protein